MLAFHVMHTFVTCILCKQESTGSPDVPSLQDRPHLRLSRAMGRRPRAPQMPCSLRLGIPSLRNRIFYFTQIRRTAEWYPNLIRVILVTLERGRGAWTMERLKEERGNCTCLHLRYTFFYSHSWSKLMNRPLRSRLSRPCYSSFYQI